LINIDPLHLFGFELTSVAQYFYVLLIWLALVLLVIYRLNQSRIGRAWRSMGEDALAAEVMGMPTRRLKLLAFACGAAIAGVTGGIFAAWQGSAFPQNFAADVLINLYAMMVLGGIGNLAGAVLGAGILSIVPELLRNPELIRMLFYAGLVIGLLAFMRPRRQGALALAGVIVFGIVVRLAAQLLIPDLLSPPTITVASASVSTALQRFSQQFGIFTQQWILLLKEPALPGNLAFGAFLPILLIFSRLQPGRLKRALLVPVLYLLAFVWETRFTSEPAVTRLLLVGSLLVIMMVFRPHGLLGRRKVEIV
jgi:ABC-type branched-subunit amino acid transport system permease subunit